MLGLTILTLCALAAYAAIIPLSETIIGVGFGLALDYGTASVYFSNGCIADIIKVEGSPEYRAAMRSPTAVADYLSIDERESWHIPAQTTFTPVLIKQKSTCDYFPSQITCTSPERPFDSMIQSLKQATESHLQTTISHVEITFDYVPSPAQIQAIQAAAAATSVNLGPQSNLRLPGGIKVASAMGLDGSCVVEDDVEQLLLTVDYSSGALTAILFHEECGYYEPRRMVHDLRLGVGALAMNPQHVSQNMQSVLHELTRLPLEQGNGKGVDFINNVVVTGEASGNPIFQQVLREVIGPRFTDRPLAVGQYKSSAENILDSTTFAVARSSAYLSYQMQQPLIIPDDPCETSLSLPCLIQSELNRICLYSRCTELDELYIEYNMNVTSQCLAAPVLYWLQSEANSFIGM